MGDAGVETDHSPAASSAGAADVPGRGAGPHGGSRPPAAVGPSAGPLGEPDDVAAHRS